jgi:hypothetical protein
MKINKQINNKLYSVFKKKINIDQNKKENLILII